MDTDPFVNPTTFGSRNASFAAGRFSPLHNVARTASANPSAGFASPAGPVGQVSSATSGVRPGLTGVSASQRSSVWGTGRGSGTVNGISAGDQAKLATMPWT
jgi:hypothetical protein